MKLQHLAVGARFEYEGKVFVKTGPITATSEEGGQRVIPRSAILKPLDLPTTPPPTAGRFGRLDKHSVLTAFDQFYQECSQLTDASVHPALEAARQRFLGAIK